MKRRAMEQSGPFQHILLDVLGHILASLSQQDACAARKTCRSWRRGKALWRQMDLAKLDPARLQTVFAACHPLHVKEADVSGLQLAALVPKFKFMESLTVSNAEDEHLEHIAAAQSLRDLRIHWATNISDAALVHISGLTSLRSLTLENVRKSTDAGVAALARLIHLREFSMSGSGITDHGVTMLVAAVSNLERLRMASCDSLTDKGIIELANLTALTDLNLSGCLGLTGLCFAHLEHLPIKNLKLSNCSFINESLVHISRLEGLQKLVLSTLR